MYTCVYAKRFTCIKINICIYTQVRKRTFYLRSEDFYNGTPPTNNQQSTSGWRVSWCLKLTPSHNWNLYDTVASTLLACHLNDTFERDVFLRIQLCGASALSESSRCSCGDLPSKNPDVKRSLPQNDQSNRNPQTESKKNITAFSFELQ